MTPPPLPSLPHCWRRLIPLLFPPQNQGIPRQEKSAPPPPSRPDDTQWLVPRWPNDIAKACFFFEGSNSFIRVYHLFYHFRLAAHYNLKNLKHNFCVHPNGGWPGEGVHLNYWPGCDEERLKLNFFKLGKALTERIVRRFLDSVRMIDKQTQFDSQSVFHIRKILNSDDFRRSCRCTIGLSSSGEKNLFAYW